ncbi:uncharacterized protein TNCV_2917881 [Trichonephila clavipes]|nr:uncharacterized protein TNCV_2917881 [Trichonephila clavipes]
MGFNTFSASHDPSLMANSLSPMSSFRDPSSHRAPMAHLSVSPLYGEATSLLSSVDPLNHCQKKKTENLTIKDLPPLFKDIEIEKINVPKLPSLALAVTFEADSLSISKYMISILKAHCHPPINDRSIANASCTAIGPPPLKSRSLSSSPSFQNYENQSPR